MLILVPRVKSAMNRRYTIPWPRERSNDFDTRNRGEPVEIVDGTEKSFAAGVEVNLYPKVFPTAEDYSPLYY